MEIAIIGLGKMGANMAQRLVEGGHGVFGFDLSPVAVEAVTAHGVRGVSSLDELVSVLSPPRSMWIMVPAGSPVDATIDALLPSLDAGDVLVDGGNSNYKDTQRRSRACASAGVELVDAGTSGGVWGRTAGYSLMVGGSAAAVERIRPALETLAPGPDRGWSRVGPSGAGHFVKMVHNGIEYGVMAAYSEGFAIMQAKDEFDLDLHEVAEVWRQGSVIRSWLLDLASNALSENPELEGIAPYVPDSGEGRWTVFEAIDLNVPAPVIALSLLQRIDSRDEIGFGDRLLAALRNQFGGHSIKAER